MIYIIEGMDNCLKDTIIYELRSVLPPETQVVKFSNPPRKVDEFNYQLKHFQDMFEMMATTIAERKRNLILNRSHLGEFVYAPIYRKYDADWIFELEQIFLQAQKEHSDQSLLLLFYDSNNEKLKIREDGKSLSRFDNSKLDDERSRFLLAFDKSQFSLKSKFDISDYTRPDMDIKKEVDIIKIIKQIAIIAGIG